jgi:hypothetical protein
MYRMYIRVCVLELPAGEASISLLQNSSPNVFIYGLRCSWYIYSSTQRTIYLIKVSLHAHRTYRPQVAIQWKSMFTMSKPPRKQYMCTPRDIVHWAETVGLLGQHSHGVRAHLGTHAGTPFVPRKALRSSCWWPPLQTAGSKLLCLPRWSMVHN